MDVVEYYHGILFEERAGVQLLHERAISHKNDPCVAIDCGVEPDLMGDFGIAAA